MDCLDASSSGSKACTPIGFLNLRQVPDVDLTKDAFKLHHLRAEIKRPESALLLHALIWGMVSF